MKKLFLGISMVLFLGLVSCSKEKLVLKKVSETLVYSNAPFPSCHASTIVENAPNEFMISAFGGSEEGADDVCIWLSKSEDGANWQAPIKMADGVMNDSLRHPTWNPVLFKAREGKLFLFYKKGPSPMTWWGVVRTSDDNGATWSDSKRLPDGVLGPIKNKPIQLADGTLLSPASTETDERPRSNWKTHIERSTDLGKTWEIIRVDPETAFSVIQPSILEYKGGKLQLLCRSRDNSLLQAFSEDKGISWSAFSKTELPNPNSGTDAVTLNNGWQVLVYNPTIRTKEDRGRSQLNVAVSRDGKKWTDVVELENDKSNELEYSYPAVIQAIDEKIHITYTYDRVNVKHVVLEVI